ncbi:alpha-methylacyl-CoA racemase [Epargyreus clarus]|uniref:alpha-methylacyl-CoA racemase n=1 Tax=Epargyreus clarus TaxID=520877 RepID=UPI003C302015
MSLKGIKVVEMMGLAPGPFCGAILADFGATVTVVQKLEPAFVDVMSNGKRVISINLKSKSGIEIVKKMCSTSDVLLDTYRPGVMEKLGLGPKTMLQENSRLIYARLSGYGQDGHYKSKAGHDINYIAMSGVLHMLRKNDDIPTPVNFAADFAGGSVLCALGIILALYERTQSNLGQVIDASMTEGAAYVASWFFRSRNSFIWPDKPGKNMLDGGAPFYGSYLTKDGKFMAVGALEPQFYLRLLKGLQLPEEEYAQGENMEYTRKKFIEVFLTKTQKEWCKIFENLDACVTPVLDFQSVDQHECHVSRNSFFRDDSNIVVPRPSPRLSRTPGKSCGQDRAPQLGQHTLEILKELGYSKLEIDEFIKTGSVHAVLKSNL